MEFAKLYFNIVPLLAALAVIVIGVVVFVGDRKNKVTRLWFMTCFFAATWSAFFFFVINASTKEASMILRIFLDASAILVMYFWLRFVLAFLNIRNRKISYSMLIGTTALLFFNMSPWFINDMVPKYIFDYYVNAGIGYYFFVLYFVVIALTGLFLLYTNGRVAGGAKSQQIKNIFRGSLVGFVGSSGAFLLSFNIPFPPFLFILFAGFPLIIGRGIVRYNLFNIRIIATELLTLAIWIFLAVRLMFSETTQDIVINASLLAVVIVFGILLVKSVWNEVKQREKIENLAKELAMANKKQEDLLHIMNHDVKKPLSRDIGILASILDGSYGSLSPQMKELVEEGLKLTRADTQKIIDFLNDANLKTGEVKYASVPFDLRRVVESAVQGMKKELIDANVQLKIEVESDNTYLVKGDEDKFSSHVLGNLLKNLTTYARGKSAVLSLTDGNGKILLKLKDTGIGITSDDMKNLFTKGGKGAKAVEINKESTGEGLYDAKMTAEAHGGKIWAESEGAGKGSSFFVELPVE